MRITAVMSHSVSYVININFYGVARFAHCLALPVPPLPIQGAAPIFYNRGGGGQGAPYRHTALGGGLESAGVGVAHKAPAPPHWIHHCIPWGIIERSVYSAMTSANRPATLRLLWARNHETWFGLVYWGLTPQQRPGSYQGGEMMMIKSVFWWRKPEYPEETTETLRRGHPALYTKCGTLTVDTQHSTQNVEH